MKANKSSQKKRATTSNWQKIHPFFALGIIIFSLHIGIRSYKPKIHQSAVLSTQLIHTTPTYIPALTPSPKPTFKNESYCIFAPSILYHHIKPLSEAQKEGHAQLTVDSSIFEQHLKYLSDSGYHAISAEALAYALINHTALPSKPIVITLDDGYIDAYTHAFPLAKKYNMIINLMIPTGLLENPGYLSWSQLQEMINSGLVIAHNHTWSHFSLPSADTTKLHFEISTSKKDLQTHLGKSDSKIFTYPYGSFDNKTIDALKQEGYIAAYSTLPSFTQCDSEIFALRRNHVGNAPLSAYGF